MGPPLIVIALFLKKYVGYTAYRAAKDYGNVYFYEIIKCNSTLSQGSQSYIEEY